MHVYLNNCAYKVVNKQMTNYLDENLFEDQILKMLYYDRIDINKGSKECMICHIGFLIMDISDLAIITIQNVDYHCIIMTLANLKQLIY